MLGWPSDKIVTSVLWWPPSVVLFVDKSTDIITDSGRHYRRHLNIYWVPMSDTITGIWAWYMLWITSFWLPLLIIHLNNEIDRRGVGYCIDVICFILCSSPSGGCVVALQPTTECGHGLCNLYSWLPFGLKPIFSNWACKHNTHLIELIHDYRRCQGNEEWIITSDNWANNCNNRSFLERSTRFGTPSPRVELFWWNRWPPKNSRWRPIFGRHWLCLLTG